MPKAKNNGKEATHQFGEAAIDASVSAWVERFIQENLPISPVPSVPEILLHRAGPWSGLSRLAERVEDFGAPYWAYDWGGGLALARHILDNPEIVVGRRVLDLGAGSGIVGIAAMKAGAREVVAADTDPCAMAAIDLNAAVNGIPIVPIRGDLTVVPPPTVDLVLVGDLFYDHDLAERVTSFLNQCLEANISILIGDPWRAFLPRTRLQLLAEYPGPDFGDISRVGQRKNAVFSFEPACRQVHPCRASE
ncbi:class I SAM-dependent methyltransferase [Nitratireductor luteus]|uniref:class I SAM-dependent methyltransferase n=1 Tax=Nitratireductor luteus TaxID=2976980 RepID=UPI003B846D9F